MQNSKYAFDTTSFIYSLKLLSSIFCVLAFVQYGTVLASQRPASDEVSVEQNAATQVASVTDTNEMLEKIEEFEEQLATRTIGTASVDSLSRAHTRLIAADLSEMKLYLFDNGVATATYPILSKGKRGSRWETPTGLYKVEAREEDHFSSLGQVHMPQSMQFFGNFYIHGWPYYTDGTPVPEGYSGGCIRLSTEDATKVFEFSERGTPIFVWESQVSTSPVSVSPVRIPKISAKAFLVADVRSGTVYVERNADTVFPIASLTKLLTALVANETIHYNRVLSISRDDRAQTEGTPGFLAVGDSFEAEELIYPLLMESNNTVAYTLARYFGADNFMRWMNDKTKSIGMWHTAFEDPSGISENNVSTASDLFLLMRYIHDSQSFILNVSREPERKIHSIDGRSYTIRNLNVFSGNPQFVGGKTGYTDAARQTMTALFDVSVGNATTTLAIVVLGSSDRKKDVERLLSWFKSAATTTFSF